MEEPGVRSIGKVHLGDEMSTTARLIRGTCERGIKQSGTRSNVCVELFPNYLLGMRE